MASKPTRKPAAAATATASQSRSRSSHFLFGEMDMIDQMVLLLVGLVLLLANLGLIDPGLVAFWPLVLIVIAIKEMLQSN